MTRRANYVITENAPDFLEIRDVGPWDIYLSVTNAAETVVEELAPILNGRRLFYYDTDGQCDEILVEDNKFAGFKAGRR